MMIVTCCCRWKHFIILNVFFFLGKLSLSILKFSVAVNLFNNLSAPEPFLHKM